MSFEIGQVVREIGGTRLFVVVRVPDSDDPRLHISASGSERVYMVKAEDFAVVEQPVVPEAEAAEPVPEPKRRGRPPKAKP